MLRVHTFLDITHLEIAWVANAANSYGGRVSKRPRISASVENVQVSGGGNSHTCNAIILRAWSQAQAEQYYSIM